MRRLLGFRLFAGIGLLVAAEASGLSQGPSPRDVLERFCELDAQAEQLSPGGWQKLAALFSAPGAPRLDTIIVVRDFVVSRPAFERDKARFYAEYIQLGRIDPSQARFVSLPAMKVRTDFYVVRQSAPGPAEWRIEGPMPDPHLTVDAAIRYGAELRKNAANDTIRKNADKTLATLRRLH